MFVIKILLMMKLTNVQNVCFEVALPSADSMSSNPYLYGSRACLPANSSLVDNESDVINMVYSRCPDCHWVSEDLRIGQGFQGNMSQAWNVIVEQLVHGRMQVSVLLLHPQFILINLLSISRDPVEHRA